MASVEFCHCRKAYPPRAGGTATEVLKGIDLTVADGESLSGGDVLVGGRSVQHLSPARRNVAMVFQSYSRVRWRKGGDFSRPHQGTPEQTSSGL